MRSFFVISFFYVCFFVSLPAIARQVKGRPTLPSDCTANEHWVRDHPKSKADYTAYCRVNRGHQTIPASYKFVAPRIKLGRPKGWPWPQERTAKWSENQIVTLLAAVEKLPERLWLPLITGIYRLQKSKDVGNPASSGGGFVVLYDDAFHGKEELAQIIAHELAHYLYSDLSDQERRNYEMATGWATERDEKTGKMKVILARPSGYVKSDGKFSPEEDFANNIEYFLFHPKALKETTPHAHSWISGQFGDSFKVRK